MMKAAYCLFLLITAAIGGRFLLEYSRAVMETRQPAARNAVSSEDPAADRSPASAAPSVNGNRAPEDTPARSSDMADIREMPAQESSESGPVPVPEITGSSPIRHPGPTDSRTLLPGNFEYLGAFRPPHVEGLSSKFSWGGAVVAWNPHGDPQGADDGFPGSLFLSGHVYDQQVAELSIPVPVVSGRKSMDELSVAELLQPFGDITGGILAAQTTDSSQPFRLGGLCVTGRTLHWTMYRYYNVEGYDFLSHGMSSLSVRRPFAAGPWHLGPYQSGEAVWHAYKHAGYICQAPPSAAPRLGGRTILSGLQISTGRQTSSQGPALFAYQLPEGPLSAGASLDAIPLLWYSMERPLAEHHPADSWTGAAWLKVNDRQAVIFVGRKATGPVYYGVGRPGDCNEYKGYHGPPYEAQILFYSADDLLDAAEGQRPASDITPRYRWTEHSPGGGLSRYLFPTCEQYLGGTAWDEQRRLLYVVQIQAGTTHDSPFEPLPVIHVFRIRV